MRTLHRFTNSETDFGESDMVAFFAIKDFVDHFGGNLCSLDFAVEDSNPRSLLFGREPRNKVILTQRHFAGGESLAQV